MHIDGLCEYCESLAVARPEGLTPAVGPIDGVETAKRVRDAVDDGGLLLLRSDSPLDRSIEFYLEESRYTIAHFLQCTRCRSYIFFGLAIRGWPIYHKVEREAVDRWPWEQYDTSINNLPGS